YRSYGSYWMQYGPRSVAPHGEARSNFQVAQALAQRMGLEDAVFRMSEREAAAELLRGAAGVPGTLDPARLPELGPINIAPTGGQEFRTPSGRLEFYSEQMARQGLPPMPDWAPDPEDAAQS